MQIHVKVNGVDYTHDVEPRMLLVHYLRDVVRLTGTHVGCDTSICGACTIHLNNQPTKSCTVFAVQADGCEITTVEGLAGEELHPLQEGFNEKHGLQCGFCTPGIIMTMADFLDHNENPSEEEIRHALKGHLCRCTGYHNIIKSVQYAADKKKQSTTQTQEVPV
ncbi:(2Fe-2S)-binding protein [Nibrella saemangeumensis]|uniref:(2Fe-2S)-binding protein n=1 Tax=Nibrella saemangeumensis TaxID=1084526 RepID=A0ABP8MVA9_9BACT